MPCHPHHLTKPSAASLGTTSALLSHDAERSAVVGREAACGIAADTLLTGRARIGPHGRHSVTTPTGRLRSSAQPRRAAGTSDPESCAVERADRLRRSVTVALPVPAALDEPGHRLEDAAQT